MDAVEKLGAQLNLGSVLTANSRWDWSQLTSGNDFVWKEGTTPLSDRSLIPFTWLIYYGVLLVLLAFMKSFSRGFSLRLVTAAHNMILCIWSAIMFVGIVYSMFTVISTEGSKLYYCRPLNEPNPASGITFYWLYIYYLSKFYELFDTVIMVLKKRPLNFLHVYHHSIVLPIVWSWMWGNLNYASVGMAFNTFVHVIMYYYYFLSALGTNVWWKKYITGLQIVQFISSFILSAPYLYYSIGYSPNGEFSPQCAGWGPFLFTCAANFSFLLLFANFYGKTYPDKTSSRKKAQ
eukprot:TRINITY_DN5433_c0_g1_i1.p1 TRINITY_DN5433_c0_g1~~TRINITY_DN5433_c0_g1_i1.p1  ORF type:complete len:319 (-),score=40.64 TRINITY_DN5433_c0_g1_i1:64-936(-)